MTLEELRQLEERLIGSTSPATPLRNVGEARTDLEAKADER